MRRTLLISFLPCFCAMTAGAVPVSADVAPPGAPARVEPPRGPAPAAASEPRTGNAAALGEAVRTARAELLRLPAEDMDPDVTPEAQRAIERLKDRIIAFANATLAGGPADASPSAIQQALAAHGDAFEDSNVYPSMIRRRPGTAMASAMRCGPSPDIRTWSASSPRSASFAALMRY